MANTGDAPLTASITSLHYGKKSSSVLKFQSAQESPVETGGTGEIGIDSTQVTLQPSKSFTLVASEPGQILFVTSNPVPDNALLQLKDAFPRLLEGKSELGAGPEEVASVAASVENGGFNADEFITPAQTDAQFQLTPDNPLISGSVNPENPVERIVRQLPIGFSLPTGEILYKTKGLEGCIISVKRVEPCEGDTCNSIEIQITPGSNECRQDFKKIADGTTQISGDLIIRTGLQAEATSELDIKVKLDVEPEPENSIDVQTAENPITGGFVVLNNGGKTLSPEETGGPELPPGLTAFDALPESFKFAFNPSSADLSPDAPDSLKYFRDSHASCADFKQYIQEWLSYLPDYVKKNGGSGDTLPLQFMADIGFASTEPCQISFDDGKGTPVIPALDQIVSEKGTSNILFTITPPAISDGEIIPVFSYEAWDGESDVPNKLESTSAEPDAPEANLAANEKPISFLAGENQEAASPVFFADAGDFLKPKGITMGPRIARVVRSGGEWGPAKSPEGITQYFTTSFSFKFKAQNAYTGTYSTMPETRSTVRLSEEDTRRLGDFLREFTLKVYDVSFENQVAVAFFHNRLENKGNHPLKNPNHFMVLCKFGSQSTPISHAGPASVNPESTGECRVEKRWGLGGTHGQQVHPDQLYEARLYRHDKLLKASFVFIDRHSCTEIAEKQKCVQIPFCRWEDRLIPQNLGLKANSKCVSKAYALPSAAKAPAGEDKLSHKDVLNILEVESSLTENAYKERENAKPASANPAGFFETDAINNNLIAGYSQLRGQHFGITNLKYYLKEKGWSLQEFKEKCVESPEQLAQASRLIGQYVKDEHVLSDMAASVTDTSKLRPFHAFSSANLKGFNSKDEADEYASKLGEMTDCLPKKAKKILVEFYTSKSFADQLKFYTQHSSDVSYVAGSAIDVRNSYAELKGNPVYAALTACYPASEKCGSFDSYLLGICQQPDIFGRKTDAYYCYRSLAALTPNEQTRRKAITGMINFPREQLWHETPFAQCFFGLMDLQNVPILAVSAFVPQVGIGKAAHSSLALWGVVAGANGYRETSGLIAQLEAQKNLGNNARKLTDSELAAVNAKIKDAQATRFCQAAIFVSSAVPVLHAGYKGLKESPTLGKVRLREAAPEVIEGMGEVQGLAQESASVPAAKPGEVHSETVMVEESLPPTAHFPFLEIRGSLACSVCQVKIKITPKTKQAFTFESQGMDGAEGYLGLATDFGEQPGGRLDTGQVPVDLWRMVEKSTPEVEAQKTRLVNEIANPERAKVEAARSTKLKKTVEGGPQVVTPKSLRADLGVQGGQIGIRTVNTGWDTVKHLNPKLPVKARVLYILKDGVYNLLGIVPEEAYATLFDNYKGTFKSNQWYSDMLPEDSVKFTPFSSTIFTTEAEYANFVKMLTRDFNTLDRSDVKYGIKAVADAKYGGYGTNQPKKATRATKRKTAPTKPRGKQKPSEPVIQPPTPRQFDYSGVVDGENYRIKYNGFSSFDKKAYDVMEYQGEEWAFPATNALDDIMGIEFEQPVGSWYRLKYDDLEGRYSLAATNIVDDAIISKLIKARRGLIGQKSSNALKPVSMTADDLKRNLHPLGGTAGYDVFLVRTRFRFNGLEDSAVSNVLAVFGLNDRVSIVGFVTDKGIASMIEAGLDFSDSSILVGKGDIKLEYYDYTDVSAQTPLAKTAYAALKQNLEEGGRYKVDEPRQLPKEPLSIAKKQQPTPAAKREPTVGKPDESQSVPTVGFTINQFYKANGPVRDLKIYQLRLEPNSEPVYAVVLSQGSAFSKSVTLLPVGILTEDTAATIVKGKIEPLPAGKSIKTFDFAGTSRTFEVPLEFDAGFYEKDSILKSAVDAKLKAAYSNNPNIKFEEAKIPGSGR